METLNYIFGSLRSTEVAIEHIGKCLRNQNKINKQFATFALVAAAHTVMVTIYIREQDKKVEELNKKIEELNESKGE